MLGPGLKLEIWFGVQNYSVKFIAGATSQDQICLFVKFSHVTWTIDVVDLCQ